MAAAPAPAPRQVHPVVQYAMTFLTAVATTAAISMASTVSEIPTLKQQIVSLTKEQDTLRGKIDTINETRFTGGDAERMERRLNDRIDRLEGRN